MGLSRDYRTWWDLLGHRGTYQDLRDRKGLRDLCAYMGPSLPEHLLNGELVGSPGWDAVASKAVAVTEHNLRRFYIW